MYAWSRPAPVQLRRLAVGLRLTDSVVATCELKLVVFRANRSHVASGVASFQVER